MAEYIVHFFYNHLPNVLTETRYIDGEEQTCIVLPVNANQIKKGKQGSWMSVFRLAPCPPNAKMLSHDLQLVWQSTEASARAKKDGSFERATKLGRVREWRRPHKATDYDPLYTGSNMELHGEIVLSDIPKSRIYKSKKNGKRYVLGLKMKSLADDRSIWTGIICVDEIPRHHILEYPDTGKKYIKVIFRNLPKLDTYMNTHILVLDTKDGSSIEVGRFREWRKEGEVIKNEMPTREIHDTPVNQRTPESIDGLKF